MFEGKRGVKGNTAKGFEEFVETVQRQKMMLYFIGILRREAGTEGKSENDMAELRKSVG
jgi:hypothetical protein